MTLEEAILLIQKDIDDEDVDWDSPLGKAYKLSFEAVKAWKLMCENSGMSFNTTLPGETSY